MKSLRWTFSLATLVFGVAVTLFFALAYPHHLHFQEQYQLFLFEKSYMCEVLSVPGGMADLIGRFLTQFFLYAWVGATIIALVLMCMQVLTYCLLRATHTEMVTYALSFIPSTLCCCFLCDENALMSVPVALIIVLLMTLFVGRINSDNVRQVAMLVSVPITYVLAGAFALPYTLLIIICELRKERSLRVVVISCLMLFVGIVTPLVWHHLINYPLHRLFAGPHYYRSPEETPLWAWVSVCILPLLSILPKKLLQLTSRHAIVSFLLVWLVMMLTGCIMVNKQQNQKRENIMAYDFMARNAQWNRIIQKSQRMAPRNQVAAVALNLALAQRGLLAKHFFDFPQNGIAGLLPNFASDYVSPLVTSEAFYRLGLINTAQRFVFEAQEAIPDFQKSARCYKRLAETNLINGDYKVARKYLLALQHTWYYRAWASETMAMIANEEAVNAHAEYGALRRMRCADDYFFGGNTIQEILIRQLESNPENSIANEYLQCVIKINQR